MLQRVVSIIALMSLLPACSPQQTVTEPLRLRVLSYNIKHCRGEDNTFNYQRLAGVIKQAKPDLVALQEVDRKTGRSKGVDQAAKLGELTSMHNYFAEAMPFSGGSYGEAVLSRWPIFPEVAGSVPLKAQPGQEPRAVAVLEVAWKGPTFVFGGTHLCHQSKETRAWQVRQINDTMVLSPEWTGVLAGDFNFTPDSEAYRVMIDAGWVDTAAAFGNPKPTFPSDRPRKRIDYVFVRPAERWRVLDVRVLHEPLASDHAPVLVVLEYIQP